MKKLLIPAMIVSFAFTSFAQTGASLTNKKCCSAKTSDKDWYSSGKKAPLFKGLEGINYSITTSNPEAQKYFNQGLMLSYGFNHAEAARSFYEATRLDSNCAMCYWGFSLVLGPNYNAGMENDNIERAYNAVQKALKLSANSSEKERSLIRALSQRYSASPVQSRAYLDSAYAAEMSSVYKKYPGDIEIATLFAESLMDTHPWDLWEKTGHPKSWTPEIIETLEKIIKAAPKHPGANHFYIHATEASKTPEKAMASADLLRDLVPGSGHLVHMPSHTYIRTGRYHDGSLANLKAVKVDSQYVETCHASGIYPLSYYPHNYHFLSATATLEGDSAVALMASRKVAELSDKKLMKDSAWGTLQHYFSIPYFVKVKFGKWDELLNEQFNEEELKYPNGVLHYAKGMASLAKNQIMFAQMELKWVKRFEADSSLSKITIWNINNASDILAIAENVLEGEILAKEGKFDEAIPHLIKAVKLEDKLNYDEPPDWFFSVRHHLGAVQLAAGKYVEAEKTYREDLQTFRENGWALIGLYNALSKQGKTKEADEVKKRFDEAWKYSSIKISSSRIL
jgi:tetratricopeptide (TPR) repeat protein